MPVCRRCATPPSRSPRGSWSSWSVRPDRARLPAAVPGARPAGAAQVTGCVLVDGVELTGRNADASQAVVGLVRQDPAAEMLGGTVESVIAAGVRPRADDPHAGQRQVEESLDLLGLADLRDRAVTELSGGQQQRVADRRCLGRGAAGAGARRTHLRAGSGGGRGGARHPASPRARRRHHRGRGRAPTRARGAPRRRRAPGRGRSGDRSPRPGSRDGQVRRPAPVVELASGWAGPPAPVRPRRPASARGLRATLAAATAAAAEPSAVPGHRRTVGGDGSVDADGPSREVRVDVQRLSLVRGDVVALRALSLPVPRRGGGPDGSQRCRQVHSARRPRRALRRPPDARSVSGALSPGAPGPDRAA